MTIREPRDNKNLAELYGEEPMPWSRVAEAIGSGSLGPETACFLGTVRPDGRPHSAGIGVAECDGDVYFETGPGTRKARNLAANPTCTLSMRLEGVDVVLEGQARRVTDAETLDRVAAAYNAGGWPAQREGDALTAPYSAQSAGPPPWNLYLLELLTAFGVGLRPPHAASRWRF
jgi:Pyridoxamine 5'-phosphate oxidase